MIYRDLLKVTLRSFRKITVNYCDSDIYIVIPNKHLNCFRLNNNMCSFLVIRFIFSFSY